MSERWGPDVGVRMHAGRRSINAGRFAVEDTMIYRLILPLMIAVNLSQPALSQLLNPFRGSSATPLQADDITALSDATHRLLDRPQLQVGSTETWSNPKSGISGTIKAGDPVQRKGLACRVVSYETVVPREPARRRTFTWCKTADGWKIG
jgi:surface antigen